MAIVKKYPARIVGISNQIKGVYTIELKSLDKPFKYDPGQFLHLTMDEYDPSDQWPESRCFSMQSNPDEKNVRITYAVKGSYTKKMEVTLKVGSDVWLKLPYGSLFTQPHNKINTVFIAGGTGVTPFLSLFTHKSFNEYITPRIYVGFRSKEYNIYHIDSFRTSDTAIYLRTFYENSDGIIDIMEIFKENGKLCDYFISGPPAMIGAFNDFLIKHEVPDSQIKTDSWE